MNARPRGASERAAAEILHGDKGYDTNAVRDKIESKGAPNIPPKVSRRWKTWIFVVRPPLRRVRGAPPRRYDHFLHDRMGLHQPRRLV